jgi:hypothetical protein
MRTLLFTATRRRELANASWPEAEHVDRHDYRGDGAHNSRIPHEGQAESCRAAYARRAGVGGAKAEERKGAAIRVLDDGRRAGRSPVSARQSWRCIIT